MEQKGSGTVVDVGQENEKRRQRSRLFALGCLMVALLWGGTKWAQLFPNQVQIQYVYRGIAHPTQLRRVEVEVFAPGQKKSHARAIYFHHDPLVGGGERITRRQRLKLSKGRYPVHVTLSYKDRPSRTLRQIIDVRAEDGTFYVYLSKATEVRPH